MSNSQQAGSPTLSRLLVLGRVFYKEVQYWCVGLTPEHYHLYQARRWSELENFNASAKHLRKYLACSNKAQVRAELGWCLGVLGRWAEAATEYETATANWSHPALRLALAEALFRSGNTQRGAEAVRNLETGDVAIDDSLRAALVNLKKEFGLAA